MAKEEHGQKSLFNWHLMQLNEKNSLLGTHENFMAYPHHAFKIESLAKPQARRLDTNLT
jgi:hypothetical protein